ISRSIFYFALAVPLSIYLTEGVSSLKNKSRILIIFGIGLLFLFLGGYSFWAQATNFESDYEPYLQYNLFSFNRFNYELLPSGLLGFVLLSLMMTFDPKERSWSYRSLFEISWRNVILF